MSVPEGIILPVPLLLVAHPLVMKLSHVYTITVTNPWMVRLVGELKQNPIFRYMISQQHCTQLQTSTLSSSASSLHKFPSNVIGGRK